MVQAILEKRLSLDRPLGIIRRTLDRPWGIMGIIRRMIERNKFRARIAIDLCLSAIKEATAALRRRDPVAAGTASSAPTPRDLIGELLSPHVLAAGGGFGLFVIRC